MKHFFAISSNKLPTSSNLSSLFFTILFCIHLTGVGSLYSSCPVLKLPSILSNSIQKITEIISEILNGLLEGYGAWTNTMLPSEASSASPSNSPSAQEPVSTSESNSDLDTGTDKFVLVSLLFLVLMLYPYLSDPSINKSISPFLFTINQSSRLHTNNILSTIKKHFAFIYYATILSTILLLNSTATTDIIDMKHILLSTSFLVKLKNILKPSTPVNPRSTSPISFEDSETYLGSNPLPNQSPRSSVPTILNYPGISIETSSIEEGRISNQPVHGSTSTMSTIYIKGDSQEERSSTVSASTTLTYGEVKARLYNSDENLNFDSTSASAQISPLQTEADTAAETVINRNRSAAYDKLTRNQINNENPFKDEGVNRPNGSTVIDPATGCITENHPAYVIYQTALAEKRSNMVNNPIYDDPTDELIIPFLLIFSNSLLSNKIKNSKLYVRITNSKTFEYLKTSLLFKIFITSILSLIVKFTILKLWSVSIDPMTNVLIPLLAFYDPMLLEVWTQRYFQYVYDHTKSFYRPLEREHDESSFKNKLRKFRKWFKKLIKTIKANRYEYVDNDSIGRPNLNEDISRSQSPDPLSPVSKNNTSDRYPESVVSTSTTLVDHPVNPVNPVSPFTGDSHPHTDTDSDTDSYHTANSSVESLESNTSYHTAADWDLNNSQLNLLAEMNRRSLPPVPNGYSDHADLLRYREHLPAYGLSVNEDITTTRPRAESDTIPNTVLFGRQINLGRTSFTPSYLAQTRLENHNLPSRFSVTDAGSTNSNSNTEQNKNLNTRLKGMLKKALQKIK